MKIVVDTITKLRYTVFRKRGIKPMTKQAMIEKIKTTHEEHAKIANELWSEWMEEGGDKTSLTYYRYTQALAAESALRWLLEDLQIK